ncbi:uncharacterized protein LOC121372607 [Gigantopelta aegis]|uniref:uncharacterized protein LOC121372607 n=1 Tax=Gigantopelta aegis TaxID=1735272 RepID=UPI001B88992B|nr:uncharacterized protein LOC121372607 [Gigantopelta aegis]
MHPVSTIVRAYNTTNDNEFNLTECPEYDTESLHYFSDVSGTKFDEVDMLCSRFVYDSLVKVTVVDFACPLLNYCHTKSVKSSTLKTVNTEMFTDENKTLIDENKTLIDENKTLIHKKKTLTDENKTLFIAPVKTLSFISTKTISIMSAKMLTLSIFFGNVTTQYAYWLIFIRSRCAMHTLCCFIHYQGKSSLCSVLYISKGLKSAFKPLVNSLKPAERYFSSAQIGSSDKSLLKNLQTENRSPEPKTPKYRPEILENNTTRVLDNPANCMMTNLKIINISSDSNLPPCESRHSGSSDARISDAKSSDVSSRNANNSDANNSCVRSSDANSSDIRSSDANSSDIRSSDANSSDVRSSDANSSDVRSSDANSSDVRSSDANSSDVRSIDVNSSDANSSDVGSIDANSSDFRSIDVNSSDANSSDVGSIDVNSSDVGSIDANSSDFRSIDVNSSDANSSDVGSIDVNSSDANSSDVGSIDANSSDANSSDVRSIDVNSIDANSSDVRSSDVNSSDVGSIDVNSIDANSSDVRSIDVNSSDANSSDVRSIDVNSIDANSSDVRSSDARSGNNNSSYASSSDVRSSDASSSDVGSSDARYNDEMVRYASFGEFPSTSTWPNRLAAAGFYHSGLDDQVTCYSCGMTHRKWRRTDDPMEIHRRVSPGCRFVLNQEENHPVEVQEEARGRLIRISGVSPNLLSNLLSRQTDSTDPTVQASSSTGTGSAIPVTSTTSMESAMMVTSFDAANSSESLLIDRPITDNDLYGSPSTAGGNLTVGHGTTQTVAASAGLTTADTVRSTNVQLSRNLDRPPRTWQQPKYPKYADLDTRILTFAGRWPHPNNQTPRQLGEAGFFFSGNSRDSTTCYFCGGGLRNWIRGDNPFVEHARWFSRCEFIREVKGDKFVVLVQEMNENEEEIDYNQVMAIVTDTRPMTERLGIRIRHVDATPNDPQTESMQDNLPGTSSENSNTNTSSKEALSTAPGPATEVTGEQLTCKVCLENNVNVVFLPCGHLCCCVDCAARLRKCPLCRSRIEGTVRAYLG